MTGGPDVAAIRRDLLAAGIDPASVPQPDPVECWAENEPALLTFLTMRTQWAIGPGGPVGMRYDALPVVWTCLGIKGSRARERTLSDLRVMEDEALDWLAERRAEHG
jgi:hypothetical protein